MSQQIFVIHGGDAYSNYEEYLEALRSKRVSLERLRSQDWKANLPKALGSDFDILLPRMPNGQNAKYLEWKIYFEKLVSLMESGVVLIGHSLGGIFLAKYLSEETLPIQVRATLLVAAPFNTPEIHPLADFVLSADLGMFAEQGGDITLYHSSDDQIVPFSNLNDYRRALPNARFVTFTDRGHFNAAEFPELVADLQALS